MGGAGTGGRGSGGSGGENACARCETPCTDGVCDLMELHAGSGIARLGTMAAAFDGERLYLADGDGVEVLSIPKQGGQQTVLYPNHPCTTSLCMMTVAVDDADVFFAGPNTAGTETDAVMAVPKGGGNVRTVCTTSGSLNQLALEGPNVYFDGPD